MRRYCPACRTPPIPRGEDVYEPDLPSTRTGLTTSCVNCTGVEEKAVVQGGLSRAVCAHGSFWMVEGKRNDTVHVYMDKVEADVMWSAVIEGDVDADAG